MNNVGVLYNCSMRTNPRARLSPSVLNRVALIDARLRESGMRVFYYSPKHITPSERRVPGYVLENGEFVRTTAEIPAVNGNWTYQTRRLLDQGMGYQRLVEWAQARGIEIYVPPMFSELIGDKYETYRLVQGYRETLQPHCERYLHSVRQLRDFVADGTLTFIKPCAGSKGDRIITIRNARGKLGLTHYAGGRRLKLESGSLADAASTIERLTGSMKRYVIQQGVETLPYENSVFDIRVVMFHDGSRWGWVHEARLSPLDSDLSNVSQGGTSVVTEGLLFDVLGDEDARYLLEKLRSESFGLAAYLERLHPGDLMEIAFDFVVDCGIGLRLVEINTKPGLASIGFLRTVYDKRREHEPMFERWVYPHTSAVARFLRAKMHRRGLG